MVLRRMVHHIREEDVKDTIVPSPVVQMGLTPVPKQRYFWEASQNLAQPASAQRCQEGPLLHGEMGKEETSNGQLAFQEISDSRGGQDLAKKVF